MNIEEEFYEAQRNFDKAIVARNLTSWMFILNKRVPWILATEKEFNLSLTKDYPELQKRAVKMFYDNIVGANFSINDAETQIHSMELLFNECYIYMEEIIRINRIRGFGEHAVGPNQSRFALTVHAHLLATQTRLEELQHKATENSDFRTLFGDFIDGVNSYTGEDFDTIGEMLDKYENANHPILIRRELTVIKKARNIWAHPEGEKNDDLVNEGIEYMKKILTEIQLN